MNIVANPPYLSRYLRWLTETRTLATGERAVEIGCAIGGFSALLRARGIEVVGIDLDPMQASAASGRGVPTTVADVHHLPLRSGWADLAVMFDVIEHLHSPFDGLRELRRVLRPASQLVLTTPNINACDQYMNPGGWSGITDESHLYLFSIRALRHLLGKTGFTIDEIRTPFHRIPGRIGRIAEHSRLGGQIWIVASATL